jgi:hypothetical protein
MIGNDAKSGMTLLAPTRLSPDAPMGSERAPAARGLFRAALPFLAVQLCFSSLLILDWGHGIARGVIVAILLAGLVLFRRWFRPVHAAGDVKSVPSLVKWLAAAALVVDAGVAGVTTLRTLGTQTIPGDEGQTTWRAGRLLWQGENPYAVGAVVDFASVSNRSQRRSGLGIESSFPSAESLRAALQDYDKTLDPAVRTQILPVPETGTWTDPALSEASVLGYKYGPVILVLTAPTALTGTPASLLVLRTIVCFGLFAVFWRLMARGGAIAALGMVALVLDPFIIWNYLVGSSTDVWALLFSGIAVQAYVARRPMMTAGALALGVSCKIFPSLIFFPLLLHFRSVRPVALFAGVLAVIYLPWLAWDPFGFVNNAFLWPVHMAPDTTSWSYYAHPAAVAAIRGAAFAAIALVWYRFSSGRETRLFWTLACVNTLLLLTGNVFHNNYVPWASVWVIAAIVEAFTLATPAAQHDRR